MSVFVSSSTEWHNDHKDHIADLKKKSKFIYPYELKYISAMAFNNANTHVQLSVYLACVENPFGFVLVLVKIYKKQKYL